MLENNPFYSFCFLYFFHFNVIFFSPFLQKTTNAFWLKPSWNDFEVCDYPFCEHHRFYCKIQTFNTFVFYIYDWKGEMKKKNRSGFSFFYNRFIQSKTFMLIQSIYNDQNDFSEEKKNAHINQKIFENHFDFTEIEFDKTMMKLIETFSNRIIKIYIYMYISRCANRVWIMFALE